MPALHISCRISTFPYLGNVNLGPMMIMMVMMMVMMMVPEAH